MTTPDLKFPAKLVSGKLVKRYKRFFADAILQDGETVTAHCPNTGSMKTCGEPGDTIYLLHNPSPKRKLAYTWELTKTKGGFIGINTARPNNVVKQAIAAGRIPELTGYETIKGEKKYGTNSRIDLYLADHAEDERDCYVEIKNCTLAHDGRVVFPDAVTERGLKHIRELQEQQALGSRCVMFFFVNRPDGACFSPADHIHPEYGEALREAHTGGLEVLAYRAGHTMTGIRLLEPVPVEL